MAKFPTLTKKQKGYGILAAVAAAGAGIYLAVRPKYTYRKLYNWDDDDITTRQGSPVTVRLPRAEQYLVASPDLAIIAQRNFANETHLTVIPVPTSIEAYPISTVIIDQVGGATYPITVVAVPMEIKAPAKGTSK